MGSNLFTQAIFWHPKTEAAGIPFKVVNKVKQISLSEDREVNMQVWAEVNVKSISGVIIVSSSFWLSSLKLGRMSSKLKKKVCVNFVKIVKTKKMLNYLILFHVIHSTCSFVSDISNKNRRADFFWKCFFHLCGTWKYGLYCL